MIVLLAAAALAADLNTATAAELQTLRGIGPARAAAIVEYRAVNGAYASIEDLAAVPGIGTPTVHFLRQQAELVVEPGVTKGVSDKVDVNLADAAELATLPGVGLAAARRIVEDRRTNGLFRSCADLERVAGIGPATVSAAAARCTTEPHE